MIAIIKRELKAYFSAPTGYIFLAGFFIFSGVFLYLCNLIYATADMSELYSLLFTLSLLLLPLLTMRLMSEEKKQKTDQLLLTSPVSLSGLVFGKFLAAFLMYMIGLSITLIYALVLAVYTSPGWAMVFGNYIGLAFVGGAIIAIGLFISSLTESQVVAAIGTYAAVILVLMIDLFAAYIPIDFLSTALMSLSFFNRYSEFTLGLFNLEHMIFFFSVYAVFIFLTVRILDKKRWN
ncbi:MAG: ABC transporter permease subunit [Oscillospiraceae bacterium]|nr:ABC transporter permease subunit [Oscillospiraceae bacterium]